MAWKRARNGDGTKLAGRKWEYFRVGFGIGFGGMRILRGFRLRLWNIKTTSGERLLNSHNVPRAVLSPPPNLLFRE
jgi:hypothetical protein